jgi:hypothetical protein
MGLRRYIRKPFLILLATVVFFPTVVNAAISVYEPELQKMRSWTQPQPDDFYSISMFGIDDYLYYNNWDIEVDGVVKGQMILMRPKSASELGRTFAHPTKVRAWAQTFNGNPDFVEQQMNIKITPIEQVVTGKIIKRAYSRDIARFSGALINI